MSVKIMIDSASDLTQAQAKEMGLLFMPMNVMIDGVDYLDGVTLFADEFYRKLETCASIPQTSLINEYRWSEAFNEAISDGDELVVITISSKLSGTYRAALSAAKGLEGKVFVVDSMTVASGEGVLAEYALRLREEGKSASEIYERLESKKGDVYICAVIDTLKYLKKGGRISGAAAIVGTTLAIKPIVSLVEGEVKVVGKALGNKRGNLALNKMVEKLGGIDLSMPWGYLWSGNDMSNIDKYVKDSECLVEGNKASLRVLGCTIGTHVGAGAVGLAFFKR